MFGFLNEAGIIVSIIISVIAMITSLLTYRYHRRELFAKYITAERSLHLKNYKELFASFAHAYEEKNIDAAMAIKIELELQFSPVSYLHKETSELLEQCLVAIKSGESFMIEKIIEKAQIIIKNEWEQMKIEVGSKKFIANAIHDWTRYKWEKQF